MRFLRSPTVFISLGLAGATLAVASAGLDVLGIGHPGAGPTQIAGIAAGFALIIVAVGLARPSSEGPDVRDVPWILGAAAACLTGVATLLA
ncbi:MAG TPA: hypothetical protein ENO23_09810, partial [Alphaproteobacteria bacterium]|nr:hypothetical protein [Alphaproteobacteria bacterium]